MVIYGNKQKNNSLSGAAYHLYQTFATCVLCFASCEPRAVMLARKELECPDVDVYSAMDCTSACSRRIAVHSRSRGLFLT